MSLEKPEKNAELNFLYQQEKHNKKKVNKSSKKKKQEADAVSASKDGKFNFDQEIVIGVTKLSSSKEQKQRKIEAKEVKKNKGKKQERLGKKTGNRQEVEKKRETQKKNNKIVVAVIKWTFLLIALLVSIVFFLMSPLFNITAIEIIGNEKLAVETYISLSELTMGENIYRNRKIAIAKKIKQNPYVETVQIRRKLPSTIEIRVKERKANYQLTYANSYAYLSKQGYLLEITEEKANVPVILGFQITEDKIKPGNRLETQDLTKLEIVLRIMESANANGIGQDITAIDVSNKLNYTLHLENKKKIVYLGEASNLSNRMLYLKAILEKEEGIAGEIFVNGDLSKENVYFREKV